MESERERERVEKEEREEKQKRQERPTFPAMSLDQHFKYILYT